MVTIPRKEQKSMFDDEPENGLTPENDDDPPFEDAEFEEGEVVEPDKETGVAKREPVTELSIEEELEEKFLQVSMALKIATTKYIKKPEFWTKWGDKYRPNHPAIARCSRRIGLSWDTKLVKETILEDYVSCLFQCKMEFTRLVPIDKSVWDVGVSAFGEWNSLKPAYKHIKDLRTFYGDIYKSGSSQAEVNALMMLMGIKNMDEADMKQLGLDTSKIGVVPFKKNTY